MRFAAYVFHPPVSAGTSSAVCVDKNDMATKATLMKMLQESRGYEQITNRRPTPRPIVLYLMQLRAQAALTQPDLPRKQFAITADWAGNDGIALPVEIKYIRAGECSLPIVFD